MERLFKNTMGTSVLNPPPLLEWRQYEWFGHEEYGAKYSHVFIRLFFAVRQRV